jgi:hypothetical protein
MAGTSPAMTVNRTRGGRFALAAAAALVAWVGLARGGHEVPVYPSYYPHQITITSIGAERAAELLADARLQAYVGAEPRFAGGAPPPSVRATQSLGDLIVVRVSPESCDALDAALRGVASEKGFVFHPYPVTPFHGDYLAHANRAEAEKARLLALPASPPKAGDTKIEAVDAAGLVAAARTSLNGWAGPPWVKTGWFAAASLFGDVDGRVLRLEQGDYRDAVERLNLERELVAALNARCDRRVAGYTVKRQYFSAEFTAGIENVGFDSLEGLGSPIFLRTVKLKNFPWNGELALGVAGKPEAAWNPIGGFGDGFGRLLWAALGDPALIPAPYDSGWMLNRIADVQENPGR